jgi:hypothetical protein
MPQERPLGFRTVANDDGFPFLRQDEGLVLQEKSDRKMQWRVDECCAREEG